MPRPLLASAFVVTLGAIACGGPQPLPGNPPPPPQEPVAGGGEETGGGDATCDKTLMCGQALTCVNGQQYPTTCGPGNCDAPIGPCPAEPEMAHD